MANIHSARNARRFPGVALGIAMFVCAGSAFGNTYYVAPGGDDGNDGTSWAQAEATIQAGVNDATNAGDEVIVSNGTYVLAGTVTIDHAITIRGFSGNRADVIVDGDGTCQCFSASAAATLASLTMTNGYGINEAYGAGIRMYAAGTITNCLFINNVSRGGGGARMFGAGTVVDCDFIGNRGIEYSAALIMDSAGSVVRRCAFFTNNAVYYGAVWAMSSCSFYDCVFTGNSNTLDAGAIRCAGGSPLISNCTFIANYGDGAIRMEWSVDDSLISGCAFMRNIGREYGGGIRMYKGTIDRCIFSYNTAPSAGGLMVNNPLVTVRNSLFFGNEATSTGGGIYTWGGGTLENCTIVGNKAPTGGGVSFGGGTTARNLIIYFNSSANYDGSPTMTNSCATPMAAGGDNSTNDPLFVIAGSDYGTNHLAGDYRLQRVSPCRNTGLNLDWMTNALNLDGKPRINETTVDMGAYEYLTKNPGAVCAVR